MENKKTTIVDVRTAEEFMLGNIPGSINIPLQEIPQRLTEFKLFAQPIILVCASGNRSGQATQFLKSFGIECENGGAWKNFNHNFQTV